MKEKGKRSSLTSIVDRLFCRFFKPYQYITILSHMQEKISIFEGFYHDAEGTDIGKKSRFTRCLAKHAIFYSTQNRKKSV